MINIKIPITVCEAAGISRLNSEPVCVSVPLCCGTLTSASDVSLLTSDRQLIPCQKKVLALWPDKSIKWLLLDFFVAINAGEKITFLLENVDCDDEEYPALVINKAHSSKYQHSTLSVNTGPGSLQLDSSKPALFEWFLDHGVGGNALSFPCEILLVDAKGKSIKPIINTITERETGPLKSVVVVAGCFKSELPESFRLNFACELSLFAGKTALVANLTLHNPDAVLHPGGFWDLGDPASKYFRDFSLNILTTGENEIKFSCKLEGEDFTSYVVKKSFEIYQESSGGENWKSKNHVNKDGDVPLTFRGYKVTKDDGEVGRGLRASPVVCLKTENGQAVACGIDKFWQNFPKAIKVNHSGISLKLFPENFPGGFELQGGEQKTHKLFFDFGATAEKLHSFSAWLNHPLTIFLEPEWYEETNVFNYFHTKPWSDDESIDGWVSEAIDGTVGFLSQREVIDEYGWRNFGDIFANHEILEQLDPPGSLISHYNNQYDILYSSLIQFCRTQNQRWLELSTDLVTHLLDIDIYRTTSDRVEFNNGIFWHTNHFLDAATATHRANSREHLKIVDSNCGGGPSLEHNYVTGLSTYYYLTGSYLARDTVINIGELVLKRLHGSNIFCENTEKLLRGIVKRSRGVLCASEGLDSYDMHNGPGRGSGNSLSVLLDVYLLTNEEKYKLGAEKIIRACIHPKDNIESRELLNAEFRWTYTIFLQALIKYMDVKLLFNEKDKMFYYAQQCLELYANWMVENEYPFLDAPDKLDAPNYATRSAQELRKVNVLQFASYYSLSKINSEKYRIKAKFFFERTLNDLKKLPTRTAVRPMAVLMQNAGVFSYINNSKSLLEGRDLNPSCSKKADVGKPHGDSLYFFLSLRLPTLISSLFHLDISKEILWLKRRYLELRKVSRKGN